MAPNDDTALANSAPMTRDQAIQMGYADQVTAAENENCDYTGRLMPDPNIIEFSASHRWTAPDGYEYTITAYYYQDAADVQAADDLDCLDWVVDKYEVR
jgi:hypothetical protein